jgi:hypothetical protein
VDGRTHKRRIDEQTDKNFLSSLLVVFIYLVGEVGHNFGGQENRKVKMKNK